MNRCLWEFSLPILIALVTVADGSDQGKPCGVSLSIVTSTDKSSGQTLDYNSKFQVLFTNHLKESIRLWSERCPLGYSTLSFRCDNAAGVPAIMRKRTPDPSAWKNEPPKTITVPAGGNYRWNIAPGAFFWGEREWIVPEPNTGVPFTVTAIFEIKPTEQAKQQGVWTGRITSEPVKAMFVDTTLCTPHDYLKAGFQKQAIKMMQADRTWIGKQDDMQRTPLHVASQCGSIEAVRWLLSHGANVNARCYNEMTPLTLAKDPEVVKLLVEHKADLNARDVCGTALQEAARDFAHLGQYPEYAANRDRAWAITKILLDAGAEYEIVSACCLGDLERVRTLTTDKGQARNPEAMRMAATYGRTAIMKLLLDRGADPGTRSMAICLSRISPSSIRRCSSCCLTPVPIRRYVSTTMAMEWDLRVRPSCMRLPARELSNRQSCLLRGA